MKLFTVGVPNSIGVFIVAASTAKRAKELVCAQEWRTVEQFMLIHSSVATSLNLEVESDERIVALTNYSDVCLHKTCKSTSCAPESTDETRELS